MINPHEINPVCTLHMRALQDRYPEIALFFRYYNQFWRVTQAGFAIIGAEDIASVARLLLDRGHSVACLNDLHLSPFDILHRNAADNFTIDVKP